MTVTTDEQRLRFRPSGRRRTRIAAGVALAALAVGGNVYVYSTLDDATRVVQVVRDVPAGTQLTVDMLRTVDADVDATVNVVAGDRLESLVGSYAKVRLVSGPLVAAATLQPGPLVSPGNSIVAVQLPDGSLPAGIRERSPVQLVIPQAATSDPTRPDPTVIEGRAVGLPVETTSALGEVSLSVEIAEDDAPTLAAADVVRIVLNQPENDPAATPDEDGAS